MSKICLCVLRNPKIRYGEIKVAIESIFSTYGIYLFGNIGYSEPLLDTLNRSNSIILSVAEDEFHDNCDFLFLPENCSINGVENTTLFSARMNLIQDLLEEMSQFCTSLELFVGDSGCPYGEYEEYRIAIRDFVDYAEELNSLNSPDIHFIF